MKSQSLKQPDGAVAPSGNGSFGQPCKPWYVWIPKEKATRFPETINTFRRNLIRAFSVITTHGESEGAWLDSHGVPWNDRCTIYMVALGGAESERAELKRIVEQAATGLHEQCLFVMAGDMETFLVWATKEGVAAPTLTFPGFESSPQTATQ